MQGKKRKVKDYPTDFMMRSNCHTALYCDIAMEAYYDALQLHSALKAAEWHLAPGVDRKAPERLKKKIITAIVFSAMTAEAFINNYLAIRLGDKAFKSYNNANYHYYDKIEVIMLDILKQEDYTSLEWYKGIRSLFDKRNSLVHSASKEMTVEEFVRSTHYEDVRSMVQTKLKLKSAKELFPNDLESQFHAVFGRQDPDEFWENPNPTLADKTHRDYLSAELEFAKYGLTSLSNMTRAIGKLDPNYDAFKDTFSPLDLLYGNDDEITIREVVFPNLGLNFTKEDLERIVIAQAKHHNSEILC